MKKFNPTISIMLFVFICVITGTACSHMTVESSPYGFESQATASASDDRSNIGPAIEISYDIEYTTAEQVETISQGVAYREIIDTLSGSSIESGIYSKLYIVDSEKLLVLRFDDIDEKCNLSGEELLSTAKLLSYPHGELPGASDPEHSVNYAIVVGENTVCTVDNGRAVCYKILLGDADIVFQDGDRADRDDIEFMSGVIVTYDYILDSMPRQAHCTKVVIVD